MVTKNYIEMCEKNEDLQREWNPAIEPNYYYRKEAKSIELYTCNNQTWLYKMKKQRCVEAYKDFIWLPTQEQLQEMVLPIFLKMYSTTHALQNDPSFIYRMIIEKFQRWINRSSPSFDKYMAMFNSMNELWLAFVMKEEYDKIWTGEKWKLN